MEPNQTYKLLYNKGNYKQNEKTTYRLVENICNKTNKGLISKIYEQHVQLSHIKPNNPIEKIGRRPKFPKKAYRLPTSTWKDAQHSYNEVTPHTGQNGHY